VNGDDIVRDEPPANDACPGDPSKIAPGACGCGVPETDTNRNGVVDCLEAQNVNSPEAVCGSCGAVGMVVYPMAMIGYAVMMFSRRRMRRIRLVR